MIAIYPGSFDPITLGHLDLINRSSILFDQIIVAVLKNPNKKPLFTIEKRIQQIKDCTIFKYLVMIVISGEVNYLTVIYRRRICHN